MIEDLLAKWLFALIKDWMFSLRDMKSITTQILDATFEDFARADSSAQEGKVLSSDGQSRVKDEMQNAIGRHTYAFVSFFGFGNLGDEAKVQKKVIDTLQTHFIQRYAKIVPVYRVSK